MQNQEWPKDIISEWLIMQTPAVLDKLGLALAGCPLFLPDCVCKIFAFLDAMELGMPLQWPLGQE